MITISVCMIVKNEEDVLARCLDCARRFADEIIVVDTGSTDKTKEIAKDFTENVYDFVWTDDFSAARNESFLHATKDYCLWLDADDILEESEIEKLLRLKETLDPQTNAVYMKYHTGFDAQGKPSFSYFRERMIRRTAGMVWQGAVHEAIAAYGKTLHTDIAVTHRKLKVKDPDRNLRIYEKELEKGHVLSPRDLFYYARELTYHRRDEEAESLLENVIDSDEAWIENRIEACRTLSQCRLRLGKPREALEALLQSLRFDSPRAEICCDIGLHFLQKKQYRQAAFWYESALSHPRNDASGAFVLPECYDYIPNIQLCVCYYYLGDLPRSLRHNEAAGDVNPNGSAYQYNQKFFQTVNVPAH